MVILNGPAIWENPSMYLFLTEKTRESKHEKESEEVLNKQTFVTLLPVEAPHAICLSALLYLKGCQVDDG